MKIDSNVLKYGKPAQKVLAYAMKKMDKATKVVELYPPDMYEGMGFSSTSSVYYGIKELTDRGALERVKGRASKFIVK